jgi:hypothetical protein
VKTGRGQGFHSSSRRGRALPSDQLRSLLVEQVQAGRPEMAAAGPKLGRFVPQKEAVCESLYGAIRAPTT